ncbi:MAG TPA: hypothetical protein ENF31_00265, partial [bacterium]|nr:hypothetical protein [bacterium]
MSLAKRILSIITIISVSVMLAGGALPARAEDTDDLAQQLAQLQQLLQQLCQSYYDATGEVLAGCEDYVSAEQPAPSGEWPAGIPEGFRFEKNLKYGMSDPDVKYLQILLNTDPDTKVAETGAGSPGNE